jgi:ferrous iron transport protein A
MTSLDQIPAGQQARIETIQADPSLLQRLLEMGLLEGELIEVVGYAPLGDPMEIRLRDYRLSLRRREASCITVVRCP